MFLNFFFFFLNYIIEVHIIYRTISYSINFFLQIELEKKSSKSVY